MLFQLNTALWDIGSPLKKCFCIFQKMMSNILYCLPAGLFKPNLYFELINHARNENIVLLMEGVENEMEMISNTAFLDLFSIACWFIQA